MILRTSDSIDDALVQAGLEPVMKQIYMTAEHLGENIELNYRSNEVAELSLEPREFAEQYLNEVERSH